MFHLLALCLPHHMFPILIISQHQLTPQSETERQKRKQVFEQQALQMIVSEVHWHSLSFGGQGASVVFGTRNVHVECYPIGFPLHQTNLRPFGTIC